MISAIVALITTLIVATAPPAEATHEVVPARAAGADRYETAATIAELEFRDSGAGTAVLATGLDFPDALAGATLTGAADAPQLLVTRTAVPTATEQALRGLGVRDVYLLGGEDAITSDVEAQLREDGYQVARIAGADRYATAAEAAREAARLEDEFGSIAGLTTAFIASGETYPDALAAGSLVTTRSDTFPMLLVGRDTYPEATARAIADLGIEQAIIVGGPEAVGPHVEAHIDEDVRVTRRVAGEDREATAVEVADLAMREFDYNGELTILARSDAFPDALAASIHAGRNDAPILLTPPGELATAPRDWLHDLCPTVDAVRALGGHAAIAEDTLATAVDEAAHCHAAPDDAGETYTVEPGAPVAVAAGETADLTTRERHDERPNQEPLDVTLFPCDVVDSTAGTFNDADQDGFADALGMSNEGHARILDATESTKVEPHYAYNARFLHGALTWTVGSDTTDCAVTVVFDDIDGDNQLPVDANGHPLEHYGARQVSWS